ncbi:uncharacterized protein M421DRAFT_30219, partial [Didymella exigua CBS 183.55]
SSTLTLLDRSTIEPKKTVKWLRIYFNNALSFKEHNTLAAFKQEFYKAALLANSSRGLPPCAVRQLYLACVSSIANYRLQNLALRKILGTFRTSLIAPQETEAALPPP